MHREIRSWFSPALHKQMEIVEYGHYGPALLLLPTAAADYLEYERFLLIDAISPFINSGKIKVYSVNSINSESWLNSNMEGRAKSVRHTQFNNYIYHEVIPFIKGRTSPETHVYTCGASLGALHAANLFFKNPWIINGCISMSGLYDLGAYTKGYWDDDCYWNSPMHYLEHLQDAAHINEIKKSKHIHVMTGSGAYEDPNGSRYLSALLHHRGISHNLDIWGYDIKHDWPTWRAMLPYLLETKF